MFQKQVVVLLKKQISEYIVDDNDTVKLEAGMKEIFTKARFEPISGPEKLDETGEN